MKKEDNKKKNSSKKGFTLIELLAIIAILSLVISITVGIIQNIIRNSKDKSYQVTISNIEKNAVNFINEYVDNIFWKEVSNDDLVGEELEYECVKVQDLIDTGYFKGDVLESYVTDDMKVDGEHYIRVEIDKDTRAIKRNIYLYEDPENLCANSSAQGTIDFSIPSGWAREKEILITYRVNRLKDDSGNILGYSYSYEAALDSGENKSSGPNPIALEKLTENEKLTVKDNGTVCAAIPAVSVSSCKSVDKIDGVGPVVSVGAMGNNTFAYEAKIPIVIKDKAKDRNGNLIDGSGVNDSTVEKLDFEVMVGSNKIEHKNISLTATNGCDNDVKSECYYDLLIKNSEGLEGPIKINVGDKKIEDMVGNLNDAKNFDVGEFKSTFIINYVGCEGTNIPSSQEKKYGVDINLSNNKPTRDGYDFVGWALKTNIVNSCNKATSKSHAPGAVYKDNKDATFYAVWKIKKYTISYDANGGSGAPSYQEKEHGKTLVLSSTKPTRTGYTFLGWGDLKTDTIADYQPGGNYTKDESKTLYAIWKVNEYTISYDANGGSGAPSSQTKTHGKDLTLSSTKPTKTGYDFLGWTETKGSQTVNYQPGGKYIKNETKILYAVWGNSEYTISYNANGGSGAPSSQTKKTGVTLKLSTTIPSRTGYTFLGWGESKTTTTVTYQPGGNYTKDESKILYAVWEANTYKVDYEVNIFSPFDSSRTIRYDGNGDPMLNINYEPVTSNLTFNTLVSTSRLNNLLIGLNPLKFSSGDQYEVTLTHVDGSYTGNASMVVKVMNDPVGLTSTSADRLTLPTSTNKVVTKTITISSGYNGYLKQWMYSSSPLSVKFSNYKVNVVIRKKAEGLTQKYTYGSGKYDVPDNLNVPVKLGYKEIVSWRLLKNSWWGDIVYDGKTINIAADHKVYATLHNETFFVTYDGNGKSLNYSPSSYTYDTYDVEAEDKAVDEVKIQTYDKDDKSTFAGWRFKIQPFGDNGDTLWFGCSNKYVNETASGYEIVNAEKCYGQSNPTIGWYKAEDIAIYYVRGGSGSDAGGINKSNFLGFNATAVAQWK